jgi:hypothetical protein
MLAMSAKLLQVRYPKPLRDHDLVAFLMFLTFCSPAVSAAERP